MKIVPRPAVLSVIDKHECSDSGVRACKMLPWRTVMLGWNSPLTTMTSFEKQSGAARLMRTCQS